MGLKFNLYYNCTDVNAYKGIDRKNFWGCVGVVNQVYTVGVDTHKSFRNKAIVVMES